MRVNEKSYLNLLWQDWLNQTELKPLDRWIKNWFKVNKQLSRMQKLELSQAMFTAMRFIQAVDFLEQSFVQKQLIDSVELWDRNWQLDNLKQLPAQVFWSWIELINEYHGLDALTIFNQDVADVRNKNKQLRRPFFEQILESLSEAQHALIAGFRPQWLALLTQRRVMNQWSQAQSNEFIKQQLSAPPLWLRLSQDSSTDSTNRLVSSLQKQGIKAFNQDGNICIDGGRDITASPEYKQGIFEIQDLASQQIALAVAAKPGQKVWDTCAGAGGKSLAIASKMQNKGCVVATDLHEYKLAEVKKRAKRAGYFNIRSFSWDGASKLRLPKEAAQQQGFDWVLIDAPCTSAGTWRRNPDAKWRFSEKDTQEQVKIQRQILSYAHHAVRKNGYLVYATCSWQISENEAQVADFLAENANFKLVSQELTGAPNLNSDTMFFAIMQKVN